jgi:hypothetical protein
MVWKEQAVIKVGTEIACISSCGVVMFFESSVAESLRLGTQGVVAASLGLHVVPSGCATWHTRSS